MNDWTPENFLDAHSHAVEAQAGGLVIGLDGQPMIEGTFDNVEAARAAEAGELFQAVHYITKDFPPSDAMALKYHGRREGYTSQAVIADLATRTNARLIVLDTLNEPEWNFIDYWAVVKAFPDKQIVLAHCGGLDAPNFVKIAMFEKNVWIDFSYTQTLLGFTGERPVHRLVCDTIEYCISEPRIRERCMFGSDNPFASQLDAVRAYGGLPNASGLLGGNFVRLLDIVRS